MSSKGLFHYLKFEIFLLVLLILLALVISVQTKDISFGLLVSLFIYFIWHWVALFRYFNWLSNTSIQAPSLFGMWNHFIDLELSSQFKVKKTKSRYRQILKQLEITTKAFPDATVLINDRNRIEWSNDTAFSLLGISEKDRGLNIFKVIKPKEFEDCLRKGSKEVCSFKHYKNPNITLNVKIIDYSKKQRLILARDISQQLQLQNTRRSFVANASHELRTPLTVVTGYLEILQADDELMSHYSLPVNQAMEQAQRMNNIIDDLLELSKIEQSKTMQSDKDEINMAEMLTKLIHSLKPEIDKRKATVEADFDSNLSLKGNKNQIHSLSENLIKNALIHNMDRVKLQIKWQLNSNRNPVLTVKDNGFGIPQDQLQHVTERFYRVDNPQLDKVPGTGLGLSIVKHIVNSHEAELEIDSELDFGTEFTITFPKHRALN